MLVFVKLILYIGLKQDLMAAVLDFTMAVGYTPLKMCPVQWLTTKMYALTLNACLGPILYLEAEM